MQTINIGNDMVKCLILLATISIPAFSESGFMEFDSKPSEEFKVKRSKWLLDFGMKYINYEADLAAFEGEHVSVSDKESISTYNVNLGFGREFYIAGGVSFSIKASGYFGDNDFEKSGNAAEDIDFQVSSYREKFELLGQEASASLNYIFENSIMHIQPFVEFAVGRAEATISKIYNDKGVTSTPPTSDDYAAQNYSYVATEKFTYSRFGVGINFLSNYNLNSYIKASQNSFKLDEREIEKLEASSAVSAPNESGINQFFSASMGLNYTF